MQTKGDIPGGGFLLEMRLASMTLTQQQQDVLPAELRRVRRLAFPSKQAT
jgi:hypothetical protein